MSPRTARPQGAWARRPTVLGACPRRAADRGAIRERGQASLEFVGVLALLLFVALAAIQLGIAAYTVQQAGTGARAAARTATYRETEDQSPQAAGEAAMSGWLHGTFALSSTGTGIRADATVHIPAIIPLLDFGDAHRSVTMPLDRLPGGP